MEVKNYSCNFLHRGEHSGDVRARVGYYLSSDKILSSNDLLIDSDLSIFRSMFEAEAESETFSVPNTLQPGVYYILFVADYLGEFDEVDQENNIEAIQLTVLDLDVDETAETNLSLSCLGGNGRVDLNIVNTETAISPYTLEFGNLVRQRSVVFEDWGRISITGRPAGTYTVGVKRDGTSIYSDSVTIDCSDSQPYVSSPEVTIVNACVENNMGAVNGFVLFQMVNPTSVSRSYVIEFDGVQNRSTTAAAYGQAVRGTSGRPDGFYGYKVRTGSNVIDQGTVEVDCD